LDMNRNYLLDGPPVHHDRSLLRRQWSDSKTSHNSPNTPGSNLKAPPPVIEVRGLLRHPRHAQHDKGSHATIGYLCPSPGWCGAGECRWWLFMRSIAPYRIRRPDKSWHLIHKTWKPYDSAKDIYSANHSLIEVLQLAFVSWTHETWLRTRLPYMRHQSNAATE